MSSHRYMYKAERFIQLDSWTKQCLLEPLAAYIIMVQFSNANIIDFHRRPIVIIIVAYVQYECVPFEVSRPMPVQGRYYKYAGTCKSCMYDRNRVESNC